MEKALGELPPGYETTPNETNLTEHKSDRTFMGYRMYDIARSLDLDLVEKYVQEGRALDADFIVEVYKKMELELQKPH